MSRIFPAGVATGNMVTEIFQYAKEKQFALPAVNGLGPAMLMLLSKQHLNSILL